MCVCVLCNWKFDWSFSLFADAYPEMYPDAPCIILKLIDEENYVDIIYGVYFIRRSWPIFHVARNKHNLLMKYDLK